METTDWITVALMGVLFLAVFLWVHRPSRVQKQPKRKQVAVDGTNVLFWRDGRAELATLGKVLARLDSVGLDPVVFFDASTRHHIGDKSLSERKLADVLGVPQERVTVCPARTEADAFILQYAKAQKLAVVSNDRFRDRPQEARNIRLIKGRFEGERLVLKGLQNAPASP